MVLRYFTILFLIEDTVEISTDESITEELSVGYFTVLLRGSSLITNVEIPSNSRQYLVKYFSDGYSSWIQSYPGNTGVNC